MVPRPTNDGVTGCGRAGLSVVLPLAAAGEAVADAPAPAPAAFVESRGAGACFFLLLLLLAATGVCDSGKYLGSTSLCGAKDDLAFTGVVAVAAEGGLAPAAAATAADAKRLGDAGRDFGLVTTVGCSAVEFEGMRPVLAPLKRPGETGRGFTRAEAGEPAAPAPA